MKWLEIRIGYEYDNKALAADLISFIFYDFGLQGVLVEDSSIEIEKGLEDKALRLPKHDAVIGYLPINERIGHQCDLLKEQLKRLKKGVGIQYWISCREIDEEDWAESWKAYFWPEKITKQIVIKPTWREYDPDPQEIIIEIDPGMAFGTGTHQTTRLCVILIEKYLKKGQSFLDIGTGSGILLITAAKLGAGKGLGIDRDEVAVDIGKKNLHLNHINPKKFNVKTGNLVEKIDETYHLVVANILSEVILELLPDIKKVLKDNGLFICSGISEENQNAVIGKMKEMGFEIIEVLIKDKWVAIVGRFSIL